MRQELAAPITLLVVLFLIFIWGAFTGSYLAGAAWLFGSPIGFLWPGRRSAPYQIQLVQFRRADQVTPVVQETS